MRRAHPLTHRLLVFSPGAALVTIGSLSKGIAAVGGDPSLLHKWEVKSTRRRPLSAAAERPLTLLWRIVVEPSIDLARAAALCAAASRPRSYTPTYLYSCFARFKRAKPLIYTIF